MPPSGSTSFWSRAASILRVLAGLNRQYFSTFQFKRTRAFCARVSIAPGHRADRIENLFDGPVADSIADLERLVDETVILVEADSESPPPRFFPEGVVAGIGTERLKMLFQHEPDPALPVPGQRVEPLPDRLMTILGYVESNPVRGTGGSSIGHPLAPHPPGFSRSFGLVHWVNDLVTDRRLFGKKSRTNENAAPTRIPKRNVVASEDIFPAHLSTRTTRTMDNDAHHQETGPP